LADIGYFYNKFRDVTLRTDVLPWLYQETEAYLEELNANDSLPREMLDSYIQNTSDVHLTTIKQHNEARDNAARKAEEEE